MIVEKAEALRDAYETWKGRYHRTQDRNDLVRAQDYLRQYMTCLDNHNMLKTMIPLWEEKYARVPVPSEDRDDSFKKSSVSNKERIYTFLKQRDDWVSIRDIGEACKLSRNGVRLSLVKLFKQGRVETSKIRQNNRPMTGFRVKKSAQLSPNM